MRVIGLISDTHGYLDPLAFKYFNGCEEVWHAGDFGTIDVSDQLANFLPLRGVHGNIDGDDIRNRHPQDLRFQCEDLDVWITHIGGYPGRFDRRVAEKIKDDPPSLFICGHSHILRVKKTKQLLHLNPGAAGHQGFHEMRTAMRFEVHGDQIKTLQAIEFGPRGRKATSRS